MRVPNILKKQLIQKLSKFKYMLNTGVGIKSRDFYNALLSEVH